MKYLFFLCFLFAFSIADAQYAEVDKFAASVAFGKDYKSKAVELTSPYSSEEEKVRAIFTWIVHNISYDFRKWENMQNSRGTRLKGDSKADIERQKLALVDDHVKKVLLTKRGVCQDYAYLFQKMCDEVGIKNVFVPGHARFSPAEIGRVPRSSNHAWNAIQIDGEWYLFDATWSDKKKGEEDLKIGNGYFMVDPKIFALSHLPDDEKWQLLKNPVSKEAFAKQPFKHIGYLGYQIDGFYPMKGVVSKSDGPMTFKVSGKNLDEYPLAIVKGQTPELLQTEKIEDHYEFTIDPSEMRGEVHICVLDGESIEPLITMKFK